MSFRFLFPLSPPQITLTEGLVRRKHPATAAHLLARMAEGTGDFWRLVHEPFMDRELNRAEVQAVVAEGLRRSNWSYKRSLGVFGIAPDDYLKFMDFLRHHRLKPER